MSWTSLGLWPSWVPWSLETNLRHQHTFQVQIQLSSLSCAARTVEMWVDGWALLHRCMGGRYVPSQNWGSDSFYCTHVSTIKRPSWLHMLWNLTLRWGHTCVISGQQGRLCFTLINIPRIRGGQRTDTPCVMHPWGFVPQWPLFVWI